MCESKGGRKRLSRISLGSRPSISKAIYDNYFQNKDLENLILEDRRSRAKKKKYNGIKIPIKKAKKLWKRLEKLKKNRSISHRQKSVSIDDVYKTEANFRPQSMFKSRNLDTSRTATARNITVYSSTDRTRVLEEGRKSNSQLEELINRRLSVRKLSSHDHYQWPTGSGRFGRHRTKVSGSEAEIFRVQTKGNLISSL